jgi:hypothetical protein
MDNLKVDIQNVRVTLCDTEGKSPSVIVLSIEKIQWKPSQDRLNSDSPQHICDDCGIDSPWSNVPTLDSNQLGTSKTFSIEGMSVHIQRIPPQSNPELPEFDIKVPQSNSHYKLTKS